MATLKIIDNIFSKENRTEINIENRKQVSFLKRCVSFLCAVIERALIYFKFEKLSLRLSVWRHKLKFKTAADVLRENNIDVTNKKVIVDGRCIYTKNRNELDTVIKDNTDILVVSDLRDPVSIGVAIGSIATSIGAAGSIALIGQAATATWFGLTAATWGWIAIAGLAVSLAAGIVGYFTAPKMPSFGSGGFGLDENSATYGWDGVKTQTDAGISIPVVYGEHLIGGNIINSYIWSNGEQEYLNILIALCEGEIEEIGQIYINENELDNIGNVEQYTRLGSNEQSVIKYFEDVNRNSSPIQSKLYTDQAYNYTTEYSDVEAFEIQMRFNGIYRKNDDGVLFAYTVNTQVEYKLTTDSVYTRAADFEVRACQTAPLTRFYRVENLTSGKYDIRITRTTKNSTDREFADQYLMYINEIATDDLAYPNIALVGLRLLATDQLSGPTPNVTTTIKGLKISVPKVMNGDSVVAWDDYYWDPDAEEFKLISDDTSLTWDDETYVTQYCANPVWCIYDLLTNARYGLGDYISASDINLSTFVESAKYCEELLDDGDGDYEKRYRMDVVIDSRTKAMDILLQLTSTFGGMLFYSGGQLSLKVDKNDSPVQMFTMGNIVKDSYSEVWKSRKEKYNTIEIQYSDKNNSYKLAKISVIDEDALNDGEQLRIKELRLFVTKQSYAIRMGRYARNHAKYMNRAITFKAGIDAIAATVGDVISVSHDVPFFGQSGRLIAGCTTTLLKLDKTVTLTAGTNKVYVRFADDTIEDVEISDGAGDYTEINLSAPLTQAPAKYDLYALGLSGSVKKDYRISQISKESEFEVNITAIEMNENIYDDTEVTIPTNNRSIYTNSIPYPTDVTLEETLIKLKDGTIENAINVSFARPTLTSYYVKRYWKALIYLSDDEGEHYVLRGETTGTAFQLIGNIVDGTTYRIAVVPQAVEGDVGLTDDADYADITIVGKSAAPNNVIGFAAKQVGDIITMSWSENNDVDLYGYEIREGDSWAQGIVIVTELQNNYWELPVYGFGERRFMIKAIDTSYNYSTKETASVVEVTTTFTLEDLQDDDLDVWDNGEYSGVETDVVTSWGDIVVDSVDGTVIADVDAFEKVTTFDADFVVDSDDEQVVDSTGDSIVSSPVYDELLQMIKGYDGLYPTSASYTSEVIDLTNKLRARIAVRTLVTGADITTAMFIRTSDDNVTWSQYAPYSIGEYECRYFQMKITIYNNDTTSPGRIWKLKSKCTLQFNRDGDQDVSVVNSANISFNKSFYKQTRLMVIAEGSNYAKITAKSLTGFTVEVRDEATGNLTTGDIDWEVYGL